MFPSTASHPVGAASATCMASKSSPAASPHADTAARHLPFLSGRVTVQRVSLAAGTAI